MLDNLQLHRADVARALRNRHYERMDDGRLMFPRINVAGGGAVMGGAFRHWLNGEDERIDSNILLYAGLDDILSVYFASGAQHATFYVAAYSNAADPPPDLRAANFASTMGEFTHYTESTRPVWAKDAVSSRTIGNSTTPARFTSDATGGTVNGLALATASAKGSTSGLIVACARFSDPRGLPGTGNKLDAEYAFTASDGSA